MQVAGVADTQNMYSGKVPEITLEIILLHCSNNAITFPIGFILRLIISTICSFSHSLNMSRPKATSDKYVEMHSLDINNVFSLLYTYPSTLLTSTRTYTPALTIVMIY